MAARLGVLAAIVAFVAIAAPAEATIRKGEGTDPASDTINGGAGGHDILQAAAAADDASGTAAVAMRLAAAPAANGYAIGVLGTRAPDGSCGTPAAVFLGHVGSRAASYAVTGGSAKTANLVVEGSTVTLAAGNDPQLGAAFDCALAGIAANAQASSFYDEIDAVMPLIAETPPTPTPTATPTPAPQPAAPAPVLVPAPTTATAPPVKVPAAAKLTLSLTGAPSTIKRNKTMRLKLKIANDGSKRSSKVTVSIGKVRGLSVSKVKALSALKPAQKRTVTLKVKLTKQAKTSTNLKVTVKSGKLKESSTLLLKVGKAKKLAPAKPQPQAKKSPIVGTYWWRNVNHVDWAWDNRSLYFVDNGTVYSGFPVGGAPATCATPPAEPAEEFDTREGCLTYSFDEATGAVTIGDKAGTFTGGKLTIDGEGYWPLAFAEPGARFNFAEHKHVSFRGMCGLIAGCSVTQEYLSMSPDGNFIRSRSTTSTMGDPGLGPWTAIGSYPPDQHGTYEVLAGGKIQLAYADGTVKVETFAIDTNRDTLQPDPMGEGVLIGEDNFYPDPFPDID